MQAKLCTLKACHLFGSQICTCLWNPHGSQATFSSPSKISTCPLYNSPLPLPHPLATIDLIWFLCHFLEFYINGILQRALFFFFSFKVSFSLRWFWDSSILCPSTSLLHQGLTSSKLFLLLSWLFHKRECIWTVRERTYSTSKKEKKQTIFC